MTEFLTAALGFILAMLALGLVRILRGPGDADRMMAAQLIGTEGIAALLLLGAVTGVPAAVDVALTLALLATFASIAFVKKGTARLGANAPEEHGVHRAKGHQPCAMSWETVAPASSTSSPQNRRTNTKSDVDLVHLSGFAQGSVHGG